MTVKELMELLSKQPPDQRVILAGREGGYSDIEETEEVPILLNVNDDPYEGDHDSAEPDQTADETALYISGS